MSPYLAERWAEEIERLRHMPGTNRRRDPAVVKRIAQIERELAAARAENGGRIHRNRRGGQMTFEGVAS